MTMREARVSKGWSQDRLGVEAGGIGQNRISQIERGAAPPPKLKEAEAIAKVLGYPLGELFPVYTVHEKGPEKIETTIPVPPLADAQAESAKPAEKYSQTIPDPVAEFYKTVDMLRARVDHCIRCMDKAMQVVTKFSDYVASKGGPVDAVED